MDFHGRGRVCDRVQIFEEFVRLCTNTSLFSINGRVMLIVFMWSCFIFRENGDFGMKMRHERKKSAAGKKNSKISDKMLFLKEICL